MLERTQANHEEMNYSFHTSSYCYICYTVDEIQSDEIDVIFFTDEVYGLLSCTNSSAG